MFTKKNLHTLVFLLLVIPGLARGANLFGNFEHPEEGAVRLGGSPSLSEGRVEVYHNGRWGTVCDDDWDLNDAQVVCRQLNFPGAKSAVTGNTYGGASGPIWLDDVHCTGRETHIASCGRKSWGSHDCSHSEDAGVICETPVILHNDTTPHNTQYTFEHQTKMSEEFGQLFDSGRGCDFQISLQSPSGNKSEDDIPELFEETICAHKLFLSVWPIFNTSSETTNFTVSMSCRPYFLSFIRYFYTYKIDVTSSSAMCLHQMASQFGIKQLQEDTGRVLARILPEDTSFSTQLSLYQYAVETEDLILEENVLQFLAWNYENLTSSPAWASVSVKLFQALLTRSDVVVSDEYFLFQTLENWITKNVDSISLKTQADLLSHIRFPMIPAEKLYELETNSSLYNTHKNIYLVNTLKALYFNVLSFYKLMTNANFDKESLDYKPRIYTAAQWRTTVGSPGNTSPNSRRGFQPYRQQYRGSYYYYDDGYESTTPSPCVQCKSFVTPVHNSLYFQGNLTTWQADIFKTTNACSRQGLTCDSVPAARLEMRRYYSTIPHLNVVYRNRLLLMCQNRYIFQVLDFESNLLYFPPNSSYAYPCTDENYKYIFVVRPEYTI